MLSSHLTLAGILALGVSMTSVILLITDVLFSRGAAFLVAGAALALILVLWFVVPLTARMAGTHDRRSP